MWNRRKRLFYFLRLCECRRRSDREAPLAKKSQKQGVYDFEDSDADEETEEAKGGDAEEEMETDVADGGKDAQETGTDAVVISPER